MVTALLDADIAAYRCAAASEDADEEICILRLDKLVRDILYMVNATHHIAYLSGSNNFRKELYPEYKANRKDKPLPKWLNLCREYLVTEWGAKVTDGCEADDLLGAAQTEDTVICSIDKDLLQIPGRHFNFVKNEEVFQTELEGYRHFYHQLLMGDRSDNVPGVSGIGKVKASRFLEGCDTEQEMFNTVRAIYNDDKTFHTFGRLLWIWRYEGDIWERYSKLIGQCLSNSGEVEKSDSMTPRAGATAPSTEHTTQEVIGFPAGGI